MGRKSSTRLLLQCTFLLIPSLLHYCPTNELLCAHICKQKYCPFAGGFSCPQMELMEGRWFQLNITATTSQHLSVKVQTTHQTLHFTAAENLALHINRKNYWAAVSKSILSCLLKLPETGEIYASSNNGFKKFFDEKLPLGLPLWSVLHPQYMSY